ncbi:enoyl-CoA hydratase/isomerase family protein [Georgenia phoenicis]|uniref:enoyl-CoA hydratase/isomerase family protein n=1 Tax=unclassified Georgenia TaxID=2626815 RepID=UPI0039B05275
MPVHLSVDHDGVAHLTLARSEKRNALDRAMLEDLRRCVASIAERDDVIALVVRGEGGVFCAGADIGDWVAPTHDAAAELSRLGQDAFSALAALPVVSVAVIEGVAVGGGLELALACDLRIAACDARLGLPELALGNLPAWGGTARLADVAGLGVTRQLLLTGELISGERAAELHVVTSAHPSETLPEAVAACIDRLRSSEPYATSLAKQVLDELTSVLGVEAALAGYTACLDTSRQRKQAFLDQRAAAKAAQATRMTGVSS